MFSILLYCFVFVLSSFFMYIYERFYLIDIENKRSLLGWPFLFLAILIPCILASLRHPLVGPDSYIYVIPNYLCNDIYNGFGFWEFYMNMGKSTEIGFAFLLYVGILFDNIGVSYFLFQLFTLLPIMTTLIKLRRNGPIWIGWLVYLLLSYNFSLSGMRTSIAIAILPLSICYAYEKKYLISICLFIVSSLFHASAMLVYPIMMLIIVLSKHTKKIYLYFTFSLLFVFLFNIQFFLEKIMPLIDLVQPRYTSYLTRYIGRITWSDVPLTDFISKFFYIGIVWYFAHKSKVYDRFVFVLLFLTIVGRFFVLYNAVFYESMRLAYYFDVFLVLLVPIVTKTFKDSFANQMIASMIVILPAFLYWFYFIIYKGAYYTIPYILR